MSWDARSRIARPYDDCAGQGPRVTIEDGMFIRARAFAVHVFTAAGAALALAPLIYAVRGQWPAMFFFLGIALIVDGIYGTIASCLRVAEGLPRCPGDSPDLAVH